MIPNQKLFYSLLAGTSLIFAACSSDKDLPIENITIVEEGAAKPTQIAKSEQPTAILGKGGSISGLLSQTFTNIVEPGKAKHVVVACSDLDTYESEITSAYQRGNLITIVDPDGTYLEDWCNARGMIFYGDPTTTDASYMVSFNRKATSMALQKTTKHKEEEEVEEDNVPMVVFTGWLDDVLATTLKGQDFRSRDIKKRVAPQHVSHVFTIDIPEEEIKNTGWGMPQNVSLSTTAKLSCDVYPLHSFADNASFSGDLYVVEAELTVHNGNLYNGRWQYTQGGKLYEACGFLLSHCHLGASLYERTATGMTHSGTHVLTGGPAPASTAVSSAYQSGFEWKFDGWLSGGSGLESTTPIPLQEGGWTWSNLAEGNMLGADIYTETEGGDVEWVLTIDGLPDNREDAAPAISSGDLTFRCSWIWGVPQATDDSTGRYYMQVDLATVYGWMRSLLPGSRREWNQVAPTIPSARIMLVPPSRSEGQRI